MKLSLPIALATVTTIGMSAIAPMQAKATQFDEFAVDQSKFVAVAVPFNYRRYKLAIIEQVPGAKSCWSESGSNPTVVDLKLLSFDHTDDCLKAVDTNGYSLRINGQDDKVAYLLNLVERNGQLELIADHQDPSKPDLVIGSTNGLRETPMKISLDTNWQFTKRLYEGDAIQHIYLSNNPNPQFLEDVATRPTTNLPGEPAGTSSNPTPQPLPPAETVASQPAPIDENTVEGLIEKYLPRLSQAIYDTYNSLFSAPSGSQSSPKN